MRCTLPKTHIWFRNRSSDSFFPVTTGIWWCPSMLLSSEDLAKFHSNCHVANSSGPVGPTLLSSWPVFPGAWWWIGSGRAKATRVHHHCSTIHWLRGQHSWLHLHFRFQDQNFWQKSAGCLLGPLGVTAKMLSLRVGSMIDIKSWWATKIVIRGNPFTYLQSSCSASNGRTSGLCSRLFLVIPYIFPMCTFWGKIVYRTYFVLLDTSHTENATFPEWTYEFQHFLVAACFPQSRLGAECVCRQNSDRNNLGTQAMWQPFGPFQLGSTHCNHIAIVTWLWDKRCGCCQNVIDLVVITREALPVVVRNHLGCLPGTHQLVIRQRAMLMSQFAWDWTSHPPFCPNRPAVCEFSCRDGRNFKDEGGGLSMVIFEELFVYNTGFFQHLLHCSSTKWTWMVDNKFPSNLQLRKKS